METQIERVRERRIVGSKQSKDSLYFFQVIESKYLNLEERECAFERTQVPGTVGERLYTQR
jgi:hypothetical protein